MVVWWWYSCNSSSCCLVGAVLKSSSLPRQLRRTLDPEWPSFEIPCQQLNNGRAEGGGREGGMCLSE